MCRQTKYYALYRFNDGSSYKAVIGKDSVTEEDIRNLRRVIKSQDKVNDKVEKLDTISIEAVICGADKHSVLNDECVDVELIIETIDEYDSLHRAIEKLLPQQQELIRKVYFEGQQASKVATELGITKQAINARLSKIYSRLKKYL